MLWASCAEVVNVHCRLGIASTTKTVSGDNTTIPRAQATTARRLLDHRAATSFSCPLVRHQGFRPNRL
ncbi:hypothetical protein F0Q45_10585 [Mycobacterium simiae]|uniref:Uncharacterized protein n=1 Tax=Mycobacterium simiae TaxID=1784 RepID=A0A5B1BT46_MYCSI|nr:hypothetical protein F0Q45_10585 [Mycobacterium simiae]